MFNNQHYNDSGVSTCAICDGFFYKGQDATICGSGDAAAEEVLYLTPQLAVAVWRLWTQKGT